MNINKNRVLFLIPSVGSGGIETYLLSFLQEKKFGLNTTIIVRSNQTGDLMEEYKALHIPILFMPLHYFNPFRWLAYFNYFKKESFNTICDFNANFAGITMMIAKLAKVENRIAFYRQGKDHFKPSLIKNGYNYMMNRLVFRNATKILANSTAGMDYFFPSRKQSDPRFTVLYNGVNINKISVRTDKVKVKKKIGIPVDSFIIGHVGRVDKSKNHSTILKVASEIIKNNSKVFLVLCGNATDTLNNAVNELGISANTRLMGFRSDVYSIMQIFDVFYFPSITEGQPNALLEAMVLGIPIITSDIKPIREIMPEDTLLYNPYDTINVIKKIIDIMKNGDRYASENYIEYVSKKFNSKENFDRFLEIINHYDTK